MNEEKSYSQDEYAYGGDEVDGCACPATAAGFDTLHPALSKLAGRFDERLRDGYVGFDDGTVADEVAETEWRAAVEEARQEGKTDEVDLGKAVIERLWGDA